MLSAYASSKGPEKHVLQSLAAGTHKQELQMKYTEGKKFSNIQDVFHVYLNKFENGVTHLFLVILGNN